jgi:hyperosmotically inducible periplasmic protein
MSDIMNTRRRGEQSPKALRSISVRLHTSARNVVCAFVLALSACSVRPALKVQSPKKDLGIAHVRLARDVRYELLLLPNYNVFDDLDFEITDDNTVVLLGQVTRPSLKSAAETAMLSLEDVGKIVDKIEVLPLSPSDDRIRLAVFHAIYSKPGLDKYGLRAFPPIHIIVSDGDVTLVGTVANEADKDLAGSAAKEVPGAFRVKNNLKVEKRLR